MYVFCYQFHIRGSKQTDEKHIRESISLGMCIHLQTIVTALKDRNDCLL